ncbi:MAG: ABC transporter permease [Vulcanisaeta sp.]|jgi:ABC-type polysaccharide/polyol phosphate export systems, permease component|nr:MAG: multidrug ABC transporter permease [Vulcanisaeta sp. JCHS_4]MCG2866424.1 ABC transporter permease [Vulcanisaeta sp.]
MRMESRLHPLHGLWSLTNRELAKWYKVPVILIISLIQPIVWLAFFGKSMNFASMFTSGLNIPGLNIPKQVIDEIASEVLKANFGTTDYFSFLAVGMLSFITLFTSLQSGMSIVWDRRLGVLSKLLTTPVPRGNIVMAKVLNSMIRSLVQASIVLVIAILLGMKLNPSLNPLDVVGAYAALALMSMGFASLFVTLALRSTSWESQMAIMNLLNMPLMFASNSFYPVKSMPWWLKPIAYINPLTYVNDINRQLLLGVAGHNLLLDFTYLLIFAIVFSALGITLSWRFLSES